MPTTVGPPLWSNGFLPAIHQGTFISNRVQTPDAEGMEGENADAMPEMPEGSRDGILRGIYKLKPAPGSKATLQLA